MTPYISFSQTTGQYSFHGEGQDFVIGNGWAGRGAGKNNHEMQAVRETGPLPCGWYSIGAPENHPTVGPYALRLTPLPETQMFGRDGFLVHGAAKDPQKYGQESKGCPILARVGREKIVSLGATLFLVTK